MTDAQDLVAPSTTLLRLLNTREIDGYTPKHLAIEKDEWGHCCFAGCTPMGCPGGCCAYGFGHRSSCPLNTVNVWREQDHDYYINSGQRLHHRTDGDLDPLVKKLLDALFEPGPPPASHNPALLPSSGLGTAPKRERPRCYCGNLVGPYGNGCCGPSGCTNVPA